MADAKPFAVAPEEAIAFLRDKLDVPTAGWADVWEAQHDKAFMVAGAQAEQLIEQFHQAVTLAIQEGRTLEQFRDDFDTIVAENGWSYHGSRNWRSKVIFETNIRGAYAAGRSAQIERVKDKRPWLRYVAVLDDRTRPAHRAWHNTILAVDHPFWDTHFPPNGWGCRCTVQSLSDRDLKRYGLKVSENPPDSPLIERTVKTAEGPKTLLVPQGIDPGFGYHPGKTWMRPQRTASAAKLAADKAAAEAAEKAAAEKEAAELAAKKAAEEAAALAAKKAAAAAKAKATKAANKAKKEAEAAAAKAAGMTPPPAGAHGGDFNKAIGLEGKFASTYGFSSTQLGKGLASIPGPPHVQANFKQVEDAFKAWKTTGVLPKPGALKPVPAPPPPDERDPKLGRVASGKTKAMLPPITTKEWKPVSKTEALSVQKESYAKVEAGGVITPEENAARHDYMGSGYSGLNDHLRTISGQPTGRYADLTARMDRATVSMELPHDAVLHRGSRYIAGIDSFEAGLAMVGDIIDDHAFASTSARLGTSEGFSASQARPPAPAVLITIRALKGMKVVPGTNYEHEWVMPRGVRFRVLDAERVGHRLHLLVEPAP